MVCDSVRNVAWMDCLYFRSRTSSSKDVVRAKALARGGLSARSTTVSGSASKPDEQWSWRSNSESPESEANLQAGREWREDATWVSAALFLFFFSQQWGKNSAEAEPFKNLGHKTDSYNKLCSVLSSSVN